MTFPTYVSTTETATRSTGSSFTAYFPASGIQSGDLIILIIERQVSTSQSYTQSSGSTFTAVANPVGSWGSSTNSGTIAIFKRVADSTENGTSTSWTSSFNSAGYCDALCTMIVVRGQDSTTPLFWSSSVATASSSNPDPPSLTTSGAQDYLWIAYACGATSSSISAYPTNYSTGHSSGGVSGGANASAIRALNATTEDPGTFTFSVSGNWGAITIAVAPPPAPKGNSAIFINIS